jgi:hypothetical protein
MTAKFTVLGNTTLTTSSSSVTFSSIPGGYKDLVIVYEIQANSGNTTPAFRVNGDSGNNYNEVYMRGNGSTAASGANANISFIAPSQNSSPDTERQMVITQFMDYSATDKHKTGLARANRAGGWVFASAFRWANTSAITSLTVLELGSANFAAGSTFRLLGVN